MTQMVCTKEWQAWFLLYIRNYSLNVILPFTSLYTQKNILGNVMCCTSNRVVDDAELIQWRKVQLSGWLALDKVCVILD